ncbi:sensor histidine kinase [Moorella sp. Hama-1]|uniref:sensor histidine kinase n=1 Tax=Moorella sp. Hama-1 TaxID=2138101 RepID=UPI000D64B4EF|nr:HAMP domain-containing sensor histidine kinase [Moorella sp. Hama-1]BCV22596.1 two-component sensor histidine kinase [Moorella sp. Hama-1]
MSWQNYRPWPGGFSSLRWRLSASYAALVLLVTALLTGLAVHTAATISLAAQRERARVAVTGVAAAFAGALGTTTADPAQIARQQGLAAGGRVFWLGPDDRVRVDSAGDARLGGQTLPLPAELADASTPRAEIYNTGTSWVAYASTPLVIAGKPAGRLLLVRDLAALRREFTELRRRLWLLGGILTLAFIGGGFIFANSLARPLERLTLAARRMQAGELHQSVPVEGSGEMVSLATAFNDMAIRVAALDEQRRAFVADAAHELRTPLAALRALAEGMNAGPETGPEGLDGFIRQTERLSRLVDSLLTLARLDNPELHLNLVPIRVSNLIQEACWTIKPLAAARRIELQTADSPGEAWVNGDPDWLHQALVNVFDNAIRYAPSGGWVRSWVRVEGGLVLITIEDAGPGVPAEALDRLGTRFYRPAAARERSSGGSGLGLAIVREVLRRHGGNLSFTCPPGHGLCVTMTLPEASPEPVPPDSVTTS